jgi:hypothetical protein
MGVWAVLDFLLLAAGGIALSLSMVWRAKNTLMNMVLSSADLTGQCTQPVTQPVILTFWS